MIMISNKTSSMVKPAERTWSGKLPLSELDQYEFPDHIPVFYFYTPSPDHEWTTILQTLKSSLSYTLVHFYPLAGRLSPVARGRLELDCNVAGVLFVEAYADKKFTELDTSLSSPIYHQLIPSIDYNNTPLEEIPLLVLQVTRFVCGGFCLGLDISHVVTDGQGTHHFLFEWARISRGELLESPPYLDRKVLRAGDPPRENSRFEPNPPPPLLMDQSDIEPEHEKETTVRMLKLTASQVEKLRKKANDSWKSGMTHGFTRYEVVTAHIWRTACKVRNHKPEQATRLDITVNVRSKMRPPLPRDYFGNAIITSPATGRSGELVSKPLGYISSKIRDAIERVDDEHANSVIDFFKGQKDLSKFRDSELVSNGGHFLGNPNLAVTSWLSLPVHGANFGWGKEVLMAPTGTYDIDGDSLILHRGDEDGSLQVVICLQVRHMEDFQKLFYQDIDNGITSKITKKQVARL